MNHQSAMRLFVGVATLVATAAVSLAGVSPASADSHRAPHLMRINNPSVSPMRAGNLINHGGPVQNAPVVYLDFWGWGSDPSGEQSYLTSFLSSVGGTSWLSSVNQYGGGSNSRLAGTWSDPAGVPSSPSDAQIQAEAANAAAHFGTGGSVNVQIVVATPTGHSTPGFGTQWCA
jgi:serine protease